MKTSQVPPRWETPWSVCGHCTWWAAWGGPSLSRGPGDAGAEADAGSGPEELTPDASELLEDRESGCPIHSRAGGFSMGLPRSVVGPGDPVQVLSAWNRIHEARMEGCQNRRAPVLRNHLTTRNRRQSPAGDRDVPHPNTPSQVLPAFGLLPTFTV